MKIIIFSYKLLASLVVILSSHFYSPLLFAELPLTIEDLMSDKGTIRINTSFSYTNSNTKNLQAADPVIVQTGDTSFVTVPTKIGEVSDNTDFIVGTIGLRYGVTSDAELYSRASYLNSSTRFSDLSGVGEETNSQFVSAWLGLNYQFSKDNRTPALLGYIEGSLYEKHTEDNSSGKSWAFGLTTYRAIDPIVLAMTVTYQLNQERNDAGESYKPGNLLLISPSVAFAVNERVTLTTGFQWTNRKADTYGNMAKGFRQTKMDIKLGLGYGFAVGNTINISFNANTSGQEQSNLRLNWLYTF
jgi:hypothetical protein